MNYFTFQLKTVFAALFAVLALSSFQLSAQSIKVTGVVSDATGPLPGVTVQVKGSDGGTITDFDGVYTISATSKDILVFSCMGYIDEEVPVHGGGTINVTLSTDTILLEDVVVVGYGVQKKESIVGAIAQVKGDALVESGSTNITNAIAGKLSGVMTIQTSGQPGENDAEILIRGVSSFNGNSPLVLVDGVERDFASLDPNEVSNISVLKDASATAVFGAKGANGVIIVTTKNGNEGKPKMDLSFSAGLSNPINTAKHIDSYTTMSLMNAAMMNDQNFSSLTSQAALEQYRNPSSPLAALQYPDVNWLKEMTNTFAQTYNANFNVHGGTKFVKYFASVGYVNEGSIFKSFNDGKVNSNYNYNRVNLRANLDFNVTRSTTVSLKLGGSVGVKNKPVSTDGDTGMWKYIFGSSTAKYPMYYPSWVLEQVPDLDYPNATGDRLLSEADQTTGNPYYQIMRGRFNQYTDVKIFSDIILNQKLDFITKGLYIQGKVSLSTYYMYNTLSSTYDRGSWYLDFSKIGSGLNPWSRTGSDGFVYVENPLYTTAPNSLQSGFYIDLYYDLSLNYNRTFKGKHNVSALVLFNRQQQIKGTAFPYYNEAYVARATYDYANRYLFEFNMGYTGSERFAPKNRYGFFPSGAIGWVISEEPFFNSIKQYWSKFKIRASAGLVGSDNAQNRWLYISEFSKDSNGYITEDKSANIACQWEEARKIDLGIELGFFNNDLRFNVDLFDEYRDKMLIGVDNNTPIWVGNTSKELNKGAVKKHGIEVEADYSHTFANGIHFSVGGNFSFNENRIVYADDAPFALEHQHKVGTAIGAQTSGAYLIDGEYLTSIDDIHSNILPVNVSDVVVGDYKFLDYTSDGKIDKDDLTRMIGSLYPPITYALKGSFRYKGFDFNIMFQGYAGKYVNFDQMYEWEFYKGNYRTHLSSTNYWSPANPSGTHAAVHYSASSFTNMSWSGYNESATTGGYNAKLMGHSWRNADYVRLKELSMGYTWDLSKKNVGLQRIKLYLQANNLLTFTGLLEGDPEQKYLVWGEYPQMRTVKLGLQFTF